MASSNLNIHLLAACCNNWGIGNKGSIPWHLPKEFKYFSKISIGNPPDGKQNVVIMGRKTWESIPASFKPLKNRISFVLSKTVKSLEGPHAVLSSLDEAIDLLQSTQWKDKIHDVFNVGGEKLYELVMNSPYCGKIYLTKIFADYECDTFFPQMDDHFKLLPPEKCPDIPQGIQVEKDVKWKVDVYVKS